MPENKHTLQLWGDLFRNKQGGEPRSPSDPAAHGVLGNTKMQSLEKLAI
jgi:hypothetical protein